jgi:hypothetical protein
VRQSQAHQESTAHRGFPAAKFQRCLHRNSDSTPLGKNSQARTIYDASNLLRHYFMAELSLPL